MREFVLEQAGKAEATIKIDGSPVTLIDVEAEDRIKNLLDDKLLGVPMLGEEGGYESELPDPVWLIDPIDGTKSYLENIPTFTGMGVLISGGEAQACVIYDYTTNDIFTAIKGRGAYKNGNRLQLSDIPMPKIIQAKSNFIEKLDSLLAEAGVKTEVSPSGGGFGHLCVVDGKSAARFSLDGGGNIHDYAPGALLVREAGGDIIPILEQNYSFRTRSFVACHPELTPLIRQRLEEIRSLEDPAQTAL